MTVFVARSSDRRAAIEGLQAWAMFALQPYKGVANLPPVLYRTTIVDVGS
jgi:hypothetical protein